MPDRFEIINIARSLDDDNFGQNMLSHLANKGDVEFYRTILSSFERLKSKEEYESFLKKLNIPDAVRVDPYKKESDTREIVDLQAISDFLDTTDETDFSRFIVMPILHAMGYKKVEYKGTVKESDFGTDFYPVYYESPAGIKYYSGVQLKACKMTNGSSSALGQNELTLIQEIEKAFVSRHIDNTGNEFYISEMIVMNSKDIRETVKKDIFTTKNLLGKNIKILGKDGVLSLIAELDFKKDFFSNLKAKKK
jgi:hypothetical protein